jgi:hypothetical protein
MKSVSYNRKKQITGASFGRKILGILLLAFLTLLFQAAIVAQEPTPSCTPKPETEEVKKVEKAYTLSYSFKASDRKYGDSTGISKQTGTFSFGMDLTDKLSFLVANTNFVIGKDATGSRAVNFGNTTFSLDYTPFLESTKWQDDRYTPTVTFDYTGTFPTGSRSRGINVGRVDHDFTVAIEKKIGKRLTKKGDKENFVRRSSVEADFGVSFGANDGGGYNKTGNFVLVYNRLLGDITRKKYKYKAEFDWVNLSNKARAQATLLNSMNFKLDDNDTRLVTGVTLGLTRGAPRVALSLKIVFNGAFVWKQTK